MNNKRNKKTNSKTATLTAVLFLFSGLTPFPTALHAESKNILDSMVNHEAPAIPVADVATQVPVVTKPVDFLASSLNPPAPPVRKSIATSPSRDLSNRSNPSVVTTATQVNRSSDQNSTIPSTARFVPGSPSGGQVFYADITASDVMLYHVTGKGVKAQSLVSWDLAALSNKPVIKDVIVHISKDAKNVLAEVMLDFGSGAVPYLYLMDQENNTKAKLSAPHGKVTDVQYKDSEILITTASETIRVDHATMKVIPPVLPAQPPVVSAINSQSMEQNGELVVNFTVNNSGADLNALKVTISSNNPDLISSSSLTLQGSGANRSVKIRPLTNAKGTAEITVTVTNGVTAPVIRKFSLRVANLTNQALVAVVAEFTGFGNGVLQAKLPPGRGIEGSTLSYVLKTQASHGSVDLHANGEFLYTPAAGYSGKDQFEYAVNDGSEESSAVTVTLNISTIVAVPPPAPVIAVSLGEVTGFQVELSSVTFNFSVANLAAGQSVAVEYRNTDTTTWLAAVASGSGAVNLRGLTAASNYEYRIRVLEGSVVKAEKTGAFRTLVPA
ncbi:MAG: hypothetical protein EXS63_09490, partial [Candidatus Omnitrophica bacterium]|nr:hypothetical protein [Candidatus Omnitrophota bacterium]